jgi:hypothetical protein
VEDPEKTTDLLQVTFYHILLHGEHLSMSGIQTHNNLMLGVIIQVDNEKAKILILTFSIFSNLLGGAFIVVIV